MEIKDLYIKNKDIITTANSSDKKARSLKVMNWNANGLNNKILDLKMLIDDEKQDIIAITEIK